MSGGKTTNTAIGIPIKVIILSLIVVLVAIGVIPSRLTTSYRYLTDRQQLFYINRHFLFWMDYLVCLHKAMDSSQLPLDAMIEVLEWTLPCSVWCASQ